MSNSINSNKLTFSSNSSVNSDFIKINSTNNCDSLTSVDMGSILTGATEVTDLNNDDLSNCVELDGIEYIYNKNSVNNDNNEICFNKTNNSLTNSKMYCVNSSTDNRQFETTSNLIKKKYFLI